MEVEGSESGMHYLALSNQLLLFIASTLSLTIGFSFHQHHSARMLRNSINQNYQTLLSRLFKVTKKIGRHSNESNENIFKPRKLFFQNEYHNFGPRGAKVIHVTGTKGKGSICQYISSSLNSSFKVGVFTSPHLHTARERIRINGCIVNKADFVRLGNEVLQEMKHCEFAVFFDYLLGMAIRRFGEEKVDYVVLEAGIGGRYDSTNFVFPSDVAAAVITNISLDHQGLLGDTIEEIAWQKAGIIKPGVHVFTPATQPESVLRVFQQQSDLVGATLHVVPLEVYVDSINNHDISFLLLFVFVS